MKGKSASTVGLEVEIGSLKLHGGVDKDKIAGGMQEIGKSTLRRDMILDLGIVDLLTDYYWDKLNKDHERLGELRVNRELYMGLYFDDIRSTTNLELKSIGGGIVQTASIIHSTNDYIDLHRAIIYYLREEVFPEINVSRDKKPVCETRFKGWNLKFELTKLGRAVMKKGWWDASRNSIKTEGKKLKKSVGVQLTHTMLIKSGNKKNEGVLKPLKELYRMITDGADEYETDSIYDMFKNSVWGDEDKPESNDRNAAPICLKTPIMLGEKDGTPGTDYIQEYIEGQVVFNKDSSREGIEETIRMLSAMSDQLAVGGAGEGIENSIRKIGKSIELLSAMIDEKQEKGGNGFGFTGTNMQRPIIDTTGIYVLLEHRKLSKLYKTINTLLTKDYEGEGKSLTEDIKYFNNCLGVIMKLGSMQYKESNIDKPNGDLREKSKGRRAKSMAMTAKQQKRDKGYEQVLYKMG